MKKLISLFLTLALTLTVFGTVTMAATTTEVSETLTLPEVIGVRQTDTTTTDEETGETSTTTTQTLTYIKPNSTTGFKMQTTSAATTYKGWVLMKIKTGDLKNVTNAVLSFYQTYDAGGYFGVFESSKEQWDIVSSKVSSEATSATLSSANDDTLAEMPVTKTGNTAWIGASKAYKTLSDKKTVISIGDKDSDMAAYINAATQSEEYIYLAVGYKASASSREGKYGAFYYCSSTSTDATTGETVYNNRVTLALTGTVPTTVTTNLDDVDSVAANFTYTAAVDSTEGSVYMVVGVYGENDALLNVQISEALALNAVTEEAPLSLSVDTSAYDASYIKAYLWDATTLEPYMAPITRTIAE